MTFDRRTFLSTLAALPLVGTRTGSAQAAPTPAELAKTPKPEQITLLGYGGPFDVVTKKYVAEPFTAATGIPVTIRGGSSDLISSLRVQKDHPQYDLVHIGFDSYSLLLRNGVFDPIDIGQIPNAAHLYEIARASHGLATTITAVTIVYNTERIKRSITSWNDLWDPAFKGHVAIEKLPATYGMDTLVMAARLAGGSEKNIDPGFRKLAELKPNLGAIYTNSSQCQQLFAQGGTWIAPWYSGRVTSTRKIGVPVTAAATKEGEPVYLTMMCPLKGKWNPWVAQFMNTHLNVDVQQAFAKEFASGPSRTDVELDPEVAKTVPYGREQVGRLLQFDWDAIIPHVDEWTQRFNREIAA
jgi:putative spermidine/putrescine transport system substrate-binding protein